MIQEFVNAWDKSRGEIEAKIRKQHPDYVDLVKWIVEMLAKAKSGGPHPDPERITCINDGSHSGTLVFIIGESGYEPYCYWFVRISYGSCSVCDTIESIREYSCEPPTEEQVADYMTLALHIIQGLKCLDSELV